MPFRRVIRYGPAPDDLPGNLSDRAVAGCWFELRRLGGCGDGELRLSQVFPDRDAIQIGDWVSLEYDEGDRWYLGRVTERRSDSPAGMRLKLEGMASQLDFVFPGGFGSDADGVAPHRYGCPELFPFDPDAAHANVDCVSRPEDLIRLLLEHDIVPATDITVDEDLIEDAEIAAAIGELKVRGTETATSLLRDLALRARNASWGVDEQGRFYLLRSRDTPAAEWKEGRDLISLREIADERYLFNRVYLTGGDVYADCDTPPCGTFRWQGNYLQPASRGLYGEHRIRLSIPWIRTPADSQAFVREFFRVYAQPTPHYRVEVAQQQLLVRPWLSAVQILDRSGNLLANAQPEVIRVEFDRTPKFRLELGPLDPRSLWSIPANGEVWPIAPSDVTGFGGGPVDVTSDGESGSSSEEESSDPGETSTDGYTDCAGCAVVAQRWKVTLSGIGNGLCTDCGLLNGAWILERDFAYSGCVWTAQHGACVVGAAASEFRFSVAPSSRYFFIVTHSLYAAKYRPVGAFDCLGPNTFELFDSAGFCTNYPATIVLEPVVDE